ncbi:hypothetical protein HDV05_000873 [Chytridiales sp. JEL 0842]|nr:hypothetical protein HDV05_000873 [Chytridiales sp. JEL 0842]
MATSLSSASRSLPPYTAPPTYSKETQDTPSNKPSPDHRLSKLGYTILNNKLVKELDGSPYEFNLKPGNHSYNQRHYEEVGDAVTEWIEMRMQGSCGLVKRWVGVEGLVDDGVDDGVASKDEKPRKRRRKDEESCLEGASGDEAGGSIETEGTGLSYIFMSRRIVINENVERGSMLDFIRRAQAAPFEWSLMVLNPNFNVCPSTGSRIKGHSSPDMHVWTIWQQVIVPFAKTADVHVVAHSYGGVCMESLLNSKLGTRVSEKLKTLVLTDSPHGQTSKRRKASAEMTKVGCIHWIRSLEPLDTDLGVDDAGRPCRSAGGTRHQDFPWRLHSEPPRPLPWPVKNLSLTDQITLPIKRALHRAHVQWMVNSAVGDGYWKTEFPTGAGIAFTQFSRVLTEACSQDSNGDSLMLETPDGGTRLLTTCSPSLRRLEGMLTPLLYERLLGPIESLRKNNESVKLSVDVQDCLIQEYYLQMGEPLRKGEKVELLDVEPSFKFMRRFNPRTGRIGDLVTQNCNYFLVTPSDEDLEDFSARKMMESMTRGVVMMVDVVVDAEVDFEHTIVSKDGSLKTLAEERCRRDLTVRLESGVLQMTDLENGLAKDALSWRIADIDHLLDSEQYSDFVGRKRRYLDDDEDD